MEDIMLGYLRLLSIMISPQSEGLGQSTHLSSRNHDYDAQVTT